MAETRSYHELILLESFKERLDYLMMAARVGDATFGSKRFLNQGFYKSPEWLSVRNSIIVRDNGFDLGIKGHTIAGKIIVHHINPISAEMLMHSDRMVFDPDNLICVSLETHNAIHYGTENSVLDTALGERKDGDTTLW